MPETRFPRLVELMKREGMSEEFQACWFETHPPASADDVGRSRESHGPRRFP